MFGRNWRRDGVAFIYETHDPRSFTAHYRNGDILHLSLSNETLTLSRNGAAPLTLAVGSCAQSAFYSARAGFLAQGLPKQGVSFRELVLATALAATLGFLFAGTAAQRHTPPAAGLNELAGLLGLPEVRLPPSSPPATPAPATGVQTATPAASTPIPPMPTTAPDPQAILKKTSVTPKADTQADSPTGEAPQATGAAPVTDPTAQDFSEEIDRNTELINTMLEYETPIPESLIARMELIDPAYNWEPLRDYNKALLADDADSAEPIPAYTGPAIWGSTPPDMTEPVNSSDVSPHSVIRNTPPEASMLRSAAPIRLPPPGGGNVTDYSQLKSFGLQW